MKRIALRVSLLCLTSTGVAWAQDPAAPPATTEPHAASCRTDWLHRLQSHRHPVAQAAPLPPPVPLHYLPKTRPYRDDAPPPRTLRAERRATAGSRHRWYVAIGAPYITGLVIAGVAQDFPNKSAFLAIPLQVRGSRWPHATRARIRAESSTAPIATSRGVHCCSTESSRASARRCSLRVSPGPRPCGCVKTWPTTSNSCRVSMLPGYPATRRRACPSLVASEGRLTQRGLPRRERTNAGRIPSGFRPALIDEGSRHNSTRCAVALPSLWFSASRGGHTGRNRARRRNHRERSRTGR